MKGEIKVVSRAELAYLVHHYEAITRDEANKSYLEGFEKALSILGIKIERDERTGHGGFSARYISTGLCESLFMLKYWLEELERFYKGVRLRSESELNELMSYRQMKCYTTEKTINFEEWIHLLKTSISAGKDCEYQIHKFIEDTENVDGNGKGAVHA